MYDLNQDITTARSEGGGQGGIYAPGVQRKYMTLGKDRASIEFRIGPAFHPQAVQVDETGAVNITDPVSFDYFRGTEPPYGLNAWARIIRIASFIGHGKGNAGGRKDILSPKSFATEGEVFCPISAVVETAQRYPEWRYLLNDVLAEDGTTVIDRSALKNPAVMLLMNIIDMTEIEKGFQLGIVSTSGYNSLIGGDTPLVNQVSANANEAILEQDPMARWACGDLTNPANGPVLQMIKERGRGQYSLYVLKVAQDHTGQAKRMPITEDLLAKRYNLLDPDKILVRRNDQDIVEQLTTVLNGVSPNKEHEYVLLKLALGTSFNIPDPPAQGSAPGWNPPAAPGAPAQGPPASSIPGMGAVPGAPVTSPVAPAVPGAPAAAPAAPTAPAAPAAPSAPAAPAAPTAPATPTAPPAEVRPPATPAAEKEAAPEAAATPQAAAAPAPGDTPPDYTREELMKMLDDAGDGAAKEAPPAS